MTAVVEEVTELLNIHDEIGCDMQSVDGGAACGKPATHFIVVHTSICEYERGFICADHIEWMKVRGMMHPKATCLFCWTRPIVKEMRPI